MKNGPKTTVSKRYPKFIRDSQTLKEFENQERIFPRLGLNNCEEPITGPDGDRYKIIFSGSGTKALWDISTMSMRGISSCQRWGGGNTKHRLIGSMIDPYCGIIYIADTAKNSYGTLMHRRALVRFIVHASQHALFLERIYPLPGADHNGHSVTQAETDETFELFSEFLRDKVKGLPVYRAKDIQINSWFIPHDPSLGKIREDQLSYRDSGLHYINSPFFSSIDKAVLRINAIRYANLHKLELNK